MKEQIVSFEIAKKLAELNFIEPCFCHYSDIKQLEPFLTWVIYGEPIGNDRHSVGFYAAPTQSLLQKWLREEHYIYISIHKHCTGSDEWVWSYSIEYLPKDKHNSKRRAVEFKEIKDTYGEFEGGTYGGGEYTYEEALEQAFQAGLKLIE